MSSTTDWKAEEFTVNAKNFCSKKKEHNKMSDLYYRFVLINLAIIFLEHQIKVGSSRKQRVASYGTAQFLSSFHLSV